jgi:predicted transposase/invertase (TIGR01784 family)
MSKRKYILFDWEVKRLFREKANFEVVEGLLSVLLNDCIKIVEILDGESNKTHPEDKFNRVDVLAKTGNGDLVIIEVQNDRELDYFHRMLYGVSKTVTEYISTGQEYANVKKVYSINILYFEMGQGEDYLYHGRTDFKGVFKNDTLKLSVCQAEQFKCDDVGDLYPEYYILRVDDFDKAAVTPLDEWFLFLKTGEIPEGATAPGLQAASERMQYDRMNKEDQREYDDYIDALRYQRSVIKTGMLEGKAVGRAEGLAEGRAEGRAEGLAEGRAAGLAAGRAEGEAELNRLKAEKEADRENLVIKSSDAGIPVEVIAQITGLTVEDVMRIMKKHQTD